MTANSNNQTLKTWLQLATQQLKNKGITSAQLDGELLAGFVLDKPRTWVHAHVEHEIDQTEQKKLEALLARRLDNEPMAYILGTKEFYGRTFAVSPEVLVPRPESEDFLEFITAMSTDARSFIDIGTGSGILAVTTALARPHWSGTATDISNRALKVAKQNAENLGVHNLVFKNQNLLANDTSHYDIVLANLPYVPKKLHSKPDLVHEPDLALFADHDGIALYDDLFQQLAVRHQKPMHVLTESLLEQHHALTKLAKTAGYNLTETKGLIQHFQRSTD